MADSDSYLKWAAATLSRLEVPAQHDLVILRSPIRPSPAQVRAALGDTVWHEKVPEQCSIRGLARRMRATRPDVLVVAATGAVAQVVMRIAARLRDRPVVVAGLPGMAVPATERALRYRAGADIFVVHSRRERAEFAQLAVTTKLRPQIVVNRLPFLDLRAGYSVLAPPTALERVVFAPQAKFPESAEDRQRILLALGRLTVRRDDLEVIVKLRGHSDEPQTHKERFPYDLLARQLAHMPGLERLRFATGPLNAFLSEGSALVTVSSTAIVEAAARGLRGLVLTDFGVGSSNLTSVFEGSGLYGTLDDLEWARFHLVAPAWAEENYLHPEPDALGSALNDLLDSASASVLPAIRLGRPVGGALGAARAYARLLAPDWVADARRRLGGGAFGPRARAVSDR